MSSTLCTLGKTKVSPRYSGEWRRSLSVGVPLRRSVVDAGKLTIECHRNESCLLVLPCGGTAYILTIRLTNPTDRSLTIARWDIKLPWEDPNFHWLEDPKGGEGDRYIVPGTSIEYPRSQVLNHRVEEAGKIARRMEGLLLGIGHAPVPDTYRYRTVPLTVLASDTRDEQHSELIEVMVDRSGEPAYKRLLHRLRSTRFEGGPDQHSPGVIQRSDARAAQLQEDLDANNNEEV